MILFKVSVPGKLSLFGEHAVKYGRTGLMGSIELRTTLTFEETSNSNIFLHVDYLPIHQTLNVPVELFLEFYNYCVQDIQSLNRNVLQRITDENKSPNHTMIVRAFYHLFIYIAYKEQIEIKACRIQLSTEFLVDNEFACSTSITVCLVICLLKWSRLQKGVNDTFDDVDLKKIQSYATYYEQFSSISANIDVYTCLHGSLTRYQDRRITHTLKGIPNMTILLVDSKQKQCLDAQVQRVIKLMKTVPQTVHSIFNSINNITYDAHYAFLKLFDIYNNIYLDPVSRCSRASAEMKVLENCICRHQSLLNYLNMSHHLDYICLIAGKHGMCGKYTDIGNGRFAYIWCPQHFDEPCTHMKRLADELTMQGFYVTETKLSYEGAKFGKLIENLKVN